MLNNFAIKEALLYKGLRQMKSLLAHAELKGRHQ